MLRGGFLRLYLGLGFAKCLDLYINMFHQICRAVYTLYFPIFSFYMHVRPFDIFLWVSEALFIFLNFVCFSNLIISIDLSLLTLSSVISKLLLSPSSGYYILNSTFGYGISIWFFLKKTLSTSLLRFLSCSLNKIVFLWFFEHIYNSYFNFSTY